jgi:hypothetical protein
VHHEGKRPTVFAEVNNCWYHYYASGTQRKIRNPIDVDFTLARYKITPDFARLLYNFEMCHWQIGSAVTEKKSIVVVKTSIGTANPPPGYLSTRTYIVGFFRVYAVKDGNIVMDPQESLLLLSDPIEVNDKLARTLFPKKGMDYWDSPKRTLAAKLGSITRNRYLELFQAEWIVNELVRRHDGGSENYLGKRYLQALLKREKDRRLDGWFSPESIQTL